MILIRKMADRPVDQRLVLNSLLCFVLTKLGKVDIKRLKSAVSVKYQPESISAAKIQLLNDSSSFTLSKPLGRYPDRHQGLNKTANELNDIFDIVQHLDECKALAILPRYVCDNSDSFPSMSLDEGELAFLLAKLDKMEATIESLKSAVYAIQAKPLYVASTVAPGPNVASSSAGQTGRQLQSQPLIQPSRPKITVENSLTGNLGKTIVNNTNSLSMATSTPSQRGQSNLWSDLVTAERRSTDYSSSAGSNYADNDDAGFQRVKSPKHRRKRVDISQRQFHQQSSAATTAGGSNQLIGVRPTRNSRPSFTTEPSGQKKNSRQPLLFGRKAAPTASNSTPTVAAAHAIKTVFLVDNLDNSCDTVSLTNFVTHMRVRVLSCFEVKPRTTRWQRAHGIIPDHRAFRVCVNRADTERFLDESKWPSDVTVSKWYSMKTAGNDHPPADSDDTEAVYRQSTPVDPPTSKPTASTYGPAAAAVAARSDDESSEEQPEGDRTVIEINLADVSMSSTDQHSSTPNQNNGD